MQFFKIWAGETLNQLLHCGCGVIFQFFFQLSSFFGKEIIQNEAVIPHHDFYLGLLLCGSL